MTDDLKSEIESVFARIAKLQLEPADGSGLEGRHRAEHMLQAIEHMITRARHQRTVLDTERARGER